MPVTQTIIAKSYAGLTLTASIHNRLTDADLAPGSTIVVDEINAGGGIYSIVITHATTLISAVTGRLKLFDGGELVDNDQLFTFAGADGETVDTGAAVLDSTVQEKLDATWKYGDVIEFSDADSGETESHRITTAKIS